MKTSFLALIALVVCAAIGWSEYTKRNPAERFYGIGQSDTRPFTVSDRWEVSWSCIGPTRISLEPTQGNGVVPIVTTSTPTMGSSYQTTGGEYTLHVAGSWPWMVSVVNVGTENVPGTAPNASVPAPVPMPTSAPAVEPLPASAPTPAPDVTPAPAAAPSTNTP